MPPGPFPMPVPAPPPQQPRPLPMNNVPAVHIVTVILPGLSAFTGYGNNYNKAKANAATQVEQAWKLKSEVEFQALTYLGPAIQELERNIKEEEGRLRMMKLTAAKRNHSVEQANGDEENNENDNDDEETDTPEKVRRLETSLCQCKLILGL